MITIDKNIPIPTNGTAGAPHKYPWRDMEVGDSFYVNGPTRRDSLSQCSSRAARIYGRKFSIRKENCGFRVWRIA